MEACATHVQTPLGPFQICQMFDSKDQIQKVHVVCVQIPLVSTQFGTKTSGPCSKQDTVGEFRHRVCWKQHEIVVFLSQTIYVFVDD